MIGEGAQSTNQRRHDYVERGVEVGFFTDPTLCIGCKACEVACKEWNGLPRAERAFTGESYDNTQSLGASTWRHVAFVEFDERIGNQIAGPMTGKREQAFGWMFLSDVCKHCENAGCLEACPTGAILRTEIGSVYVQDDICNGCAYCVVSCPFGVIDKRPKHAPGGGGAFKCSFCYDRQKHGLVPACAKTCPTESIQFGPLDELRERANRRLQVLRQRGLSSLRIYDPSATSVGGIHAFFLVPGRPERFGLPSRPVVPTVHLKPAWTSALVVAAALLVTIISISLAFCT